MPIIGPKQRTPEWYAMRRNADDPRFGATDAAGLIGASKWKSPRHIYEEFMTPPEPIDNVAMMTGRVMERPICELHASLNDHFIVHGLPTLIHPDVPVFASLDAVVMTEYKDTGVVEYDGLDMPGNLFDGPSDNEVLECKWTMSPAVASQLGEEGSDWVPNEWACQVQQQMDVADLEVAEIAVFLFGKLRVYRVPRNEDLIAEVREAAHEMRERIINREPPDPDWQHELTPELVRSMRHDIDYGSIELDPQDAELWEQQKAIGKQITALENQRKQLKARVELSLIEHDVAAGILPDGIKQVVRREASRAGYTVGPKTFWELRELKIK